MTGLTFSPYGIIGSKTEKALRIYQERYELPVTSEFDVVVVRLRATFEPRTMAA